MKKLITITLLTLLLVSAFPVAAQTEEPEAEPRCDISAYLKEIGSVFVDYGERMSALGEGQDANALIEYYFDLMQIRREVADTPVCPALQVVQHWSLAAMSDLQDVTVVLMASLLDPDNATAYQEMAVEEVLPGFQTHQQLVTDASVQAAEEE